MNKKVLWIILGVIVIALVVVGVACTSSKPQDDESLVKIETAEELQKTIEEVHQNVTTELPGLETMPIDVTDEYLFSRYTGLSSNENVESVVATMPFINAQAYEAAIIKVKAGADVEKMKQEILANINMNMWICVSAEKLYITNYKDVIFFVMGSEDWAKPVFESFKAYVGEKNVGKDLEKTQNFEDEELPPEMQFTPSTPVDSENTENPSGSIETGVSENPEGSIVPGILFDPAIPVVD